MHGSSSKRRVFDLATLDTEQVYPDVWDHWHIFTFNIYGLRNRGSGVRIPPSGPSRFRTLDSGLRIRIDGIYSSIDGRSYDAARSSMLRRSVSQSPCMADITSSGFRNIRDRKRVV